MSPTLKKILVALIIVIILITGSYFIFHQITKKQAALDAQNLAAVADQAQVLGASILQQANAGSSDNPDNVLNLLLHESNDTQAQISQADADAKLFASDGQLTVTSFKNVFDPQDLGTTGDSGKKPSTTAKGPTPVPSAVPASGDFCTALPGMITKVNARLTARTAELQTKQANAIKELATRAKIRDAALNTARVQWAANRQADYTKLSARARTDAQKQAVLTFKTNVEAAIQIRQAAVDIAVGNFRTSVSQAVSAHQALVKNASGTFASAIANAFTQAQAHCTAGVASSIVRSTTAGYVQAAQQALQTSSASIDKVGPQIQTLVGVRNTATKKAFDAFKTSVSQAVTLLKSFLKDSKTTPSVTPSGTPRVSPTPHTAN